MAAGMVKGESESPSQKFIRIIWYIYRRAVVPGRVQHTSQRRPKPTKLHLQVVLSQHRCTARRPERWVVSGESESMLSPQPSGVRRNHALKDIVGVNLLPYLPTSEENTATRIYI